jgi:YHS domain-containing protein
MRIIVILFLIVVAIALLRMLVGDVIKAVSKTMNAPSNEPPPGPTGGSSTGRLVKDPETGHYIDERTALKVDVKGKTYFFESAASRDAFFRKQRS